MVGSLWLNFAEKLQKLVEGAGGQYITSTVFGRPEAAKARKLVCTLAGNKDAKTKVKPLVDFIGRFTLDGGEEVANGALLSILFAL